MRQTKDASMEGDEPVGKAIGGIARAEALSPHQRSEIAKKAAQARWSGEVPKADYSGTLKIGSAEIRCAVVDRGPEGVIRVIVQREVVGLLTGKKKGNLDRYLQPQNLQPF